MKLGTRIFFSYLLIFSVCFYYPIDWILDTLRTRYLEGVEDPLADQANILATFAGMEMADGTFDPACWEEWFGQVYQRPLSARIYKLNKDRVDARVYITDASGIVLFDSEQPENTGKDFSFWRDVRLTLKGKYGARTTLADENDLTSSVLYVAAPIRIDGKTAGVLTVAKPTTNIKYFLKNAKPQIFQIGAIALIIAGFLSFLVSYGITRPIKRLTRYAEDISEGRRPVFPRLDRTEIGEMGAAFEGMREALEGKRYVEQYVQNLTHEIKSPLSAIRGASELMDEQMDAGRRARFLNNISSETRRIQQIIDRMLELAALENCKELQKIEHISFHSLIRTVLESKQPMLSQKGIQPVTEIEDGLMIRGDSFLLHQAISNLLQNAIDFSPEQGRITISGVSEGERMIFRISDEGPGVPDFAGEKIFDKFFSLQRPDTGKKSTGLGLNFVREVAVLHGGEVRLENRDGGGCAAEMEFVSA